MLLEQRIEEGLIATLGNMSAAQAS